ncbi:MAG: YbaB/EbfC family nucleoid-associated protein [Micromonosporaceae bacterium]|nr:YbaB/EbfC family nucleoid-associated protein [Micromonosporaceae bacterium]
MDESLEEVYARVDAELAKVQEIQATVQRMEITGHSRNNEVVAVLKGSGEFTKIQIDERTFQRYDPRSIGGLVTEAVNDALRRYSDASVKKLEAIGQELLR